MAEERAAAIYGRITASVNKAGNNNVDRRK